MAKFMKVCLIIGMLAASGCSLQRSPVRNMVDLTKTDFSNANSFKESTACATYILGFIGPFGDPSIMHAIKEAQLKSVKAVDYKSGWYLLFTKDCIIVYGE